MERSEEASVAQRSVIQIKCISGTIAVAKILSITRVSSRSRVGSWKYLPMYNERMDVVLLTTSYLSR
ncbi:hypothetical protein BPAE_0450g00040 [Botrytis paeoniae]|uniref:Uncharacterized protein n=1 Tax=Botrytis paeoniae TaxID=278948 RepID=A0A4Z1F2X0_9HELO|nr:hypothetical protein BPAE_0450g00040 [Botrytis paeoniae]